MKSAFDLNIKSLMNEIHELSIKNSSLTNDLTSMKLMETQLLEETFTYKLKREESEKLINDLKLRLGTE